MREGEISTPVTSPVTPPVTIATTGQGGESSVEFSDANIPSNYSPLNSTFSTYSNVTKAVAAQFSAFVNHGVPNEYGDIVDIGRIGQRAAEDPVSFQNNLAASVDKELTGIMEKRIANDRNLSIRDSYENIFPKSEGWTLINGGPNGLIATNPITGQYGTVSETGEFIPA